MPQEPSPWDRKDIYKDKNHERTELQPPPLNASSMPSYQHGSFREFARWGSADVRRPPGHGKRGNWHMFPEDIGAHGYVPWRSSDKILDGEACRQSVSRGDWKYSRSSSRDNSKGSYGIRDWRGHSWETSNGSPNTPGRPYDVNNELRSVDDMLTYSSRTNSDFVNTWNHCQKDQHDNRTSGVNGLGTGQRCERENSVGSVDWKPLKWSRSGSLTSWGSGFSHSGSSKSAGGEDSGEAKLELQQKNLAPVQSPSGDAAACVTSAPPSDETSSRKKPRLGWGEGLAKYEKKKDEGPDTSINSGGAAIYFGNAEPNGSLSSNLVDKSPRVLGFSDCSSPATPSSVGCSSSPGVEEKSSVKATNIDNEINACGSPSFGSQNQLEGPSFNLEKLDINSIINMVSSLIDSLQSDDPSTMDSNFVRSTAINKLLLWKGDILKTLEMTESEIDYLENELKSLKGDSKSRNQLPSTASSLPVQENGKSCEEQEAASSMIPQPAPLKVDPSSDVLEEQQHLCNGVLEEVSVDMKNGVSPGTSTFVFLASSLDKTGPLRDIVKVHDCSGNAGSAQLATTEEMTLATDFFNEEGTAVIPGEGSVLVKIDNDAHAPESSNSDTGNENVTHDEILRTNKELANSTCLVFEKLFPKDQYGIEISEFSYASLWQMNPSIRGKIAMRKRRLEFKERVLTFKFEAFRHAWKEDMLSPSRKYRAKSQKKYEISSGSAYGGYQKHRSSIRSRVTSPAGNLNLEPNAEMINFTSKLLLDPRVKRYRNALKIPALILDEKEQMSRFISSNGLVEDPFAVEKERALINPWTLEEKEIFMDNLAAFGKDFRKIATFLDHKTTADCVEFYYKNHKSKCFEKTKKKLDPSKQGKPSANTYLLTLGKKWRKEFNAVSIDVLGAASVIAAEANSGMQKNQTSSSRIFLEERYCRTSRVDSIADRSNNFDLIGNDWETAAADVLAGICGSLPSEAMSSCITSSADQGESYHRDWKCPKVDSLLKRHLIPDFPRNVDEGTCSDESCGDMDPTDWTDEEKSVFIQAVSSYGKDFSMISRCVRTRSRDQCKVFFSKASKCLGLDLIRPRNRDMGTPMSDDANGGGSDMEDASVLERSVVCSDKLGSKLEDFPSNFVRMNMDECDPISKLVLKTELKLPVENNGNHAAGQVISECGTDDMDVDCNAESLQVQRSVSSGDLNSGRNQVVDQGASVVVSASIGVAAHHCTHIDVVEFRPATGCSNEGFRNDFMAWETSLSKNVVDEHDSKCRAETSSQSICGQDSNKTSDESVGKNSSSGFSFNTEGPLPNLDSAIKPSVGKNSAAESSALHDSNFLRCEKLCNLDRLSSSIDYQGNEAKQACVSFCEDESNCLSGKPLVNLTESCQILRGYPLQISTWKETNSDVKNPSTSKKGVAGPYLAQDCHLQKCNSSKSTAGLPHLVQNLEQAKDCPKSQASNISDIGKPCRNGNVKLFGQILNSNSQDLKQNTKPSNFKSTGNTVDGNSKFSQNNICVTESVPKRSYGFWNGNWIQTGLSPLPDSAILMAKYPSAFVNYPASSSQMELQALQTVVHSTDRTLNGRDFTKVNLFDP
ncbi:uncharacterized protein LOC120153721 [Hibiscus syriacus]|uniref:uncharacterized protein LOC120153721 n=1 Tax=Hibiscus syriacus TaxID=106335 RepID=UPI0019248888|nr:uncharacterized protein LOC120153721 [Hibiscus syriacus]